MSRSLSAALILAACLPLSAGAQAEPELTPLFNTPRRNSPRPPPSKLRLAEPIERRIEELPRLGLLEYRRPKGLPYVELRVEAWFMTTLLTTEAETALTPADYSGGAPIQIQLNEYRTRQILPIIALEVGPHERISILGEYGASDFSSAGFDLTTMIDAPGAAPLTNLASGGTWSDPKREKTNKINGDARGGSTWISSSLCLRLLDRKATSVETGGFSHSLDLLMGGHSYRHEFDIRNIRVSFDDGKIPSIFGMGATVPGRIERASSNWRGPHIGLRDEVSLIAGFSFKANLIYAPYMEFRGDISDLYTAGGATRLQNPQIEARGRGNGFHVRAAAVWTWSLLRLEAGYQRLSFGTSNVRSREYGPGDAATDEPVKDISMLSQGLFASASLRF